ncbi:hypothetical protein CRUP_020723 [Coryphaenoides rupestris]|nr:hypothetical protein CRUP_020723 [Coryphaenoides rupestris]
MRRDDRCLVPVASQSIVKWPTSRLGRRPSSARLAALSQPPGFQDGPGVSPALCRTFFFQRRVLFGGEPAGLSLASV